MTISVAEGATITIEQDKDARKDYRFSLSGIIPADDTLLSVTWSAPTGITINETSHDATDAVAWISSPAGVQESWYACRATWLTAGGATDQFVVMLFIKKDVEAISGMGSALFPNKFTAVAQLRRDSLMLAAQNHFAGVTLDGAYLWDKLQAAEAQASRTLRVKFQPTAYFPLTPTSAQIAALGTMPWAEDPAYDYDPDMFQGEMWGFIATNNRPLISVTSLNYIFPSPNNVSFEVPAAWIRMDKKYGQVRIVPSTVASVPVSAFLMQIMGGARVIPHMLQLTYIAGLSNAAVDYPDLVDAVKKMAVLKIIEDSFLPQSGSISADGLSQSMSLDMSKYEDSIDRIFNGPKGSNGGLMAAIHGIRLGVM